MVIQSKAQCVLSPQAVCTVVVGMEGSLCVSVGRCQYLTGSREILKPHVSVGLYTCTLISKTQSTTAPKWWCPASFMPQNQMNVQRRAGMCCLPVIVIALVATYVFEETV